MSETARRSMSRRDWLNVAVGALAGGGVVSATFPNQPIVAEIADEIVEEHPAPPAVAAQRKDWQSEEFRKMVALGESTTAGGWSTSPERCWVPVLARLINDFQSSPMEFFNAGIGANVISTRSPGYEKSGKPAALDRLEKHVLAQEPDLLIVSYGLNDARSATTLPNFREDLTTLVLRVREHIQPVIVLLGPYYMTGFDLYGPLWSQADLGLFRQYNQAIQEVAAAESCLFVDLLAAYGDTDWMIHEDQVHANDLGHRIVAHSVFKVLAQSCSALAKKTKAAEKTSPRWRDESVLKADYGH